MNVNRGQEPRRGLTTVAVLVCLVVILLISGVLLKIGVAHRETVRAAERGLQAEWLAQAGLERARARLAASAGYAGETWQLTAADLGLADRAQTAPGKAAVVRITIERLPGDPARRSIQVQADFPPDPPYRARRSARMVVEPGAPKTGDSR